MTIDQLMQILLASHVFLAPSVTSATGDEEGSPLVLQQMVTATLVVATKHSDMPHIFGEHSDQLAPERDTQAIGERLDSYAAEPCV